jgi:PAS domain S-box-containing protein
MIDGKPDRNREPMMRAGDKDGKGKLFRGLLDMIPVTVLLVRGNRLIFVNKAAEAGTGYSRDELAAMKYWHIVHPDHRTIVKRLAREVLKRKETSIRIELKIMAKDGAEKWLVTPGDMRGDRQPGHHRRFGHGDHGPQEDGGRDQRPP